MAYYHWAPGSVKLRRMNYPQSGHPKPNGLWFDVDGAWKQWCESVEFRPENLRYRHSVTILDASRLLFLRSARDVDAFTRKYGRNLAGHFRTLQSEQDRETFARRYGRDLFSEIQRQFSNYILWDEVARAYGGIIINPYSRSRSQTYLWYYGWNCAGGCIWDLDVIRLGKSCRLAS